MLKKSFVMSCLTSIIFAACALFTAYYHGMVSVPALLWVAASGMTIGIAMAIHEGD